MTADPRRPRVTAGGGWSGLGRTSAAGRARQSLQAPRVGASRPRAATIACLTVVVCAVAAAGPTPAAAGSRGRVATDARIQGVFVMHGRVTRASGVLGEHAGQRFTTRWSITPACLEPVCVQLRLRRRRATGGVDTLTLERLTAGAYSGTGRYFVPLLCKGRLFPTGGEVRFAIRISVSRFSTVAGVVFATAINAGYRSLRRINRTPCRGSLGHDAAVYAGRRAAALPTGPQAAFATQAGASAREIVFTDTSHVTTPGARIAAWAWSFGDPASGGADTARMANPRHLFSAAGAYSVTLSVTDTNGLAAQAAAAVTVP